MKKIYTYRVQNPDLPRASRGEAAHGGAAGRGGDGLDGTPTGRSEQNTTVPLNLETIVVLRVSPKAGTQQFRCKPKEEQNQRLNRETDGRSSFLVVDQCADTELSLQSFFR